jgi:hypothetical protein
MGDSSAAFVLGMVAGSIVGVSFAVCVGLSGENMDGAFGRGRCTGWADAAGLVAAWDADGECVIGERPAAAPVAEVTVRLDAEVVP